MLLYAARSCCLGTMDLDTTLVDLQLVNQETLHLLALVTLDLDDATVNCVVDNVAVAIQLLFERLEDLGDIEGRRQARKTGRAFAAIALLVANVDVVRRVVGEGKSSFDRVTGIFFCVFFFLLFLVFLGLFGFFGGRFFVESGSAKSQSARAKRNVEIRHTK